MAHRETSRHHEAFEVWYGAGREVSQILPKLAVPERTLRAWSEWFGWHARADKRDAEAAALAEKQAVKHRAAMLERHRRAGELLTTRGMEWYEKNALETAADARGSIKDGIAIERQNEGMPDWVVAVMSADESDLDRQIAELEYRLKAALPPVPETSGDALAAARNGQHGG